MRLVADDSYRSIELDQFEETIQSVLIHPSPLLLRFFQLRVHDFPFFHTRMAILAEILPTNAVMSLRSTIRAMSRT
jgi:hypothetical protein